MLGGLDEKAGPLPLWAWGGLGALGIGVLLIVVKPSKEGDGVAPGTPITPTSTGDSSDPTGNLAAVNGMLTEVLGRLNGTGVGSGSGGGITTNGMAAANEITAQTTSFKTSNVGSIDQINQVLKSVDADINTGKGFNEYLTWKNVFNNTVNTQIGSIRSRVAEQTPNLSAADAAYLNLQAQSQINDLQSQFIEWDKPWQRMRGVAI